MLVISTLVVVVVTFRDDPHSQQERSYLFIFGQLLAQPWLSNTGYQIHARRVDSQAADEFLLYLKLHIHPRPT